LYGHDIALAPLISPQGSFDLENNYGVELFRAGNISSARERFKRSIALQPNWASSQNNLGAVLERDGALEGALAQYRKAAEMDYYLAYENTVGILIKMERYGEAEKFAEGSLAKLPNNENLRFKLAYLYAADNVVNDKTAKQKSLYLLSLILQSDPQNQQAAQLLQVLQSGQKIEL
jgi:Tfp pilus assembly protein PilF